MRNNRNTPGYDSEIRQPKVDPARCQSSVTVATLDSFTYSHRTVRRPRLPVNRSRRLLRKDINASAELFGSRQWLLQNSAESVKLNHPSFLVPLSNSHRSTYKSEPIDGENKFLPVVLVKSLPTSMMAEFTRLSLVVLMVIAAFCVQGIVGPPISACNQVCPRGPEHIKACCKAHHFKYGYCVSGRQPARCVSV